MVKVMASKLRDVELITDTGIRLGWVYDLSFDEETGDILVIVAEPDEDLDTSEFVTDHEGLLLVPVSAVKSVGEVIIIDSNKLAVKSKLRRTGAVKSRIWGNPGVPESDPFNILRIASSPETPEAPPLSLSSPRRNRRRTQPGGTRRSRAALFPYR